MTTMSTTDSYFRNHQNLPMEIIHHVYWMKQKYDLGQDMYLCGHPGALRRNMVSLFADMYGLEIEYLCITRDTTESDLKQRREIYNNSVVFHDQAPVKAAIHGRLLVLDGIEHAERNVLPALNNLLENREMNLDDGRFLMRASSIPAPTTGPDNKSRDGGQDMILPVHPNFRVIALGCSVPPYNGRTMDPPLRSRFQSRFVDELSSDSVIQLLASEISHLQSQLGKDRSNSVISSVFNLYENLRQIRAAQIAEQGNASTSLKAMPLFSLDSVSHCLKVHASLPQLHLSDTIARCVPAFSFLNFSLPSQLQTAVALPLAAISKSEIMSSTKSDQNSLYVSSGADSSHVLIGSVNGSPTVVNSAQFASLLPAQMKVLAAMLLDYQHGRHLYLLGAKVSILFQILL